jgi:hypothetical protein
MVMQVICQTIWEILCEIYWVFCLYATIDIVGNLAIAYLKWDPKNGSWSIQKEDNIPLPEECTKALSDDVPAYAADGSC